MITAMIMEIAEPKFHSPTVMNWFSMTLPIRKYCPPPSSLGMKNAETAGRNTRVMPETTPSRDSGRVTFRNACQPLAPRSLAASSRLRSIFAREVWICRIMKGRKL